MSDVQLSFIPKFEQSERIRILEARNQELAVSGKRKLYSCLRGERIVVGDHACWIDIGPFPDQDRLPSVVDGYKMTGESWGRDYAFMLDHTPANIYPCETIVGEIYWEMHMLRRYKWADTGDEVARVSKWAGALGASGVGSGHTCPDLSIPLREGYGGILERIQRYKALYERLDNPRKVNYLEGLEHICESNIRYIRRYAALAREKAACASSADEKARFEKIAACCEHIATEPAGNYYEAVQLIMFSVLFDRSVGHGNGYGRLDLYLIDYYNQGMADGTLTRREAREYLSEMFMKLRDHFFSVGGRDRDLRDATNEMSWVVLEAYDLIGDYNNMGVMWHPDMDPDFYAYACDVLARHGESIPVLINYDIMYESELRSGVPHEDAWTVCYCGCQWYCIPGKEYCDQDVNSFNAVMPMQRAIKRAIAAKTEDFEQLYRFFEEEVLVTGKALRDLKRVHDQYLGELWPEMFTSMISHGPIERGLDMVAPRGVDYQFTSTNVLGIPNVSDSLYAIKKLCFEKKMYTLEQVDAACASDWEGNEIMRQRFLNQDKYGNAIDDPDQLYARVATTISDQLGTLYNQKGQPFRPSLFHFQGHLEPERVGATPDGRHAKDYLAHGVNPTVGMNTKGLIPTAHSFVTPDLRKFQGASLQVDLQPVFFDGKEQRWTYIRDFSTAFFKSGGLQINLHILDLEKLRDAMDHPEKPEYRNLVVRVTGYCARFITLSRGYQEEFVQRMNYASL